MLNVLPPRPLAEQFREFQLKLCERIGCEADFRDRKAAAYPDDLRNKQSARALRALTERVQGLPADHPKLRNVWRLHFGPRHASTPSLDSYPELFTITERELLRVYGFHKPADGDPEKFLAEYAERLKAELVV